MDLLSPTVLQGSRGPGWDADPRPRCNETIERPTSERGMSDQGGADGRNMTFVRWHDLFRKSLGCRRGVNISGHCDSSSFAGLKAQRLRETAQQCCVAAHTGAGPAMQDQLHDTIPAIGTSEPSRFRIEPRCSMRICCKFVRRIRIG